MCDGASTCLNGFLRAEKTCKNCHRSEKNLDWSEHARRGARVRLTAALGSRAVDRSTMDIIVTLASSDASITVPDTVTITAGAFVADFLPAGSLHSR
jgi:hypothetical protein